MKIVLIEWNDSNQLFGWLDRESHRNQTLSHCYTAGILIQEKPDSYVVALSGNQDNFGNSLTIDKKCVKRIRYLNVRKVG